MYSTETMVVLKHWGEEIAKKTFDLFHRNNGCIEIAQIKEFFLKAPLNSTETMVVLKLSNLNIEGLDYKIPPKQWLY